MTQRDIDDAPTMNDAERLTLLDLVAAVEECADSDAEVMATLRHMIETDHVRFDTFSVDALPWAA